MGLSFRLLDADDIDVRLQSITSKDDKATGLILLLYKNARCDMNILDETVGPERWQRKHELINGNLFCNVGIDFDGKWVWKEDVGVESYAEKEKGQASDSFKRACFNWGIGRELYTAPFTFVKPDKCSITKSKGKFVCFDNFVVTKIAYDEKRRIKELSIYNDTKKCDAFYWKRNSKNLKKIEKSIPEPIIPPKEEKKATKEQFDIVKEAIDKKLIKVDAVNAVVEGFGKKKFVELTYEQAQEVVKIAEKRLKGE